MVRAVVVLTLVCVVAVLWSASGMAEFLHVCSDETPYSILVYVEGVKNNRGSVTIVLYGDEPKRFLKPGKKVGHLRVPAVPGVTSACVAAPHAGEYAVAVYHDEDGNGKLTRSWIGLPSEGFGFSNNPVVFLVPPSHSEAAIVIGEGTTVLNIAMQY